MGQGASKAASRAAKGATTAAAASSRGAAAPHPPPPPASTPTSSSASAVAASAQVRPPSFEEHTSPHDLAQQQLMKEQKGEDYKEMPDDLINFLKDAGPLHKQERPAKAEKREPRLPKQPWESSSSQRGSTSPERIQESMPLAGRIEGFETTKTTSFSRRTPEINPRFYQKGTTLDIYRLLSLKNSSSDETESSSSIDQQIVERVYREYGEQFPLPPSLDDQVKHKELLANTLKYLELPVIMKDKNDNQDSYDGIYAHQVEDYKMMRFVECPKTQVRLVLEDLYELENKESST